jgi:hypothetical protein
MLCCAVASGVPSLSKSTAGTLDSLLPARTLHKKFSTDSFAVNSMKNRVVVESQGPALPR